MPSGYIIKKTLLFENILTVWNLRVPLIFITIFKFQNWLVGQLPGPILAGSPAISQSIIGFGSDWFSSLKISKYGKGSGSSHTHNASFKNIPGPILI